MDLNKMPLGFGMALARNFNAMNTYSAMTPAQQQVILEKVRNARSEAEMYEIVNNLKK